MVGFYCWLQVYVFMRACLHVFALMPSPLEPVYVLGLSLHACVSVSLFKYSITGACVPFWCFGVYSTHTSLQWVCTYNAPHSNRNKLTDLKVNLDISQLESPGLPALCTNDSGHPAILHHLSPCLLSYQLLRIPPNWLSLHGIGQKLVRIVLLLLSRCFLKLGSNNLCKIRFQNVQKIPQWWSTRANITT